MDSLDKKQRLNYIQWDDRFLVEKPYMIISDIPGLPNEKKSNCKFAPDPEETIRNIRGRESEFTLNDHGFQFVRHEFSDFDITSTDEVERKYYPEVEAFLKANIEGVDRVVFFDFRVCSNPYKYRVYVIVLAS